MNNEISNNDTINDLQTIRDSKISQNEIIERLTQPTVYNNYKMYNFFHIDKQYVKRMGCSLLFCLAASYIVLCITLSSATPIISQQANAWSSFGYALIDAPTLVRFPLFVLSIASFNLWSSSNVSVNFIDVTSIFWVIIAVTIYLLPQAKHSMLVLISVNICFTLFIVSIMSLSMTSNVLKYYADNLVIITGLIYVLCGINMSVFYISNKVFLVGLLCITVGFICKLMTIYEGQYWGTSVFHLLSAFGIDTLLTLQKTPDVNFELSPKILKCIRFD
jgi:hypothetical protein